ncbi:MAG: 30S ribosomal protein THX [Bacteroidales bacterium]|jgi:30S ribosomal protein S31|nr:30S ribosomal protein THX [Bacteroidales bacterium]MDD4213596.1 30S ribosomal protein THX [Bacteroidales bacterium]
MGKGDKKSRRGKIWIGSHGVRRPRKKTKKFVPVVEAKEPQKIKIVEEVIEQPVIVEEKPKKEKAPKAKKETVETKEPKTEKVKEPKAKETKPKEGKKEIKKAPAKKEAKAKADKPAAQKATKSKK